MTGVIVLAIMLIAAIISLINSIPLSIRTIYGYAEEMLGVGPRGDATLTPKVVAAIRKESPVPVERVMKCRVSRAQVQSIVGKWEFVVIGLEQSDMEYYLGRMDSARLEGRLPQAGKPEAVVSAPVAKNLGLKLGDALLKPDSNENYSPFPVRVVGIAQTPRWLMFTNIEYMRANHFPPIDLALIFAPTPAEQRRLDSWAEERFKGERAQVFTFGQIEKQTAEMFVTLYKILNVVIGTLVVVITFMMALLIAIYQQQRLVEFGLLQAIGYTKKSILKRVLTETLAVVVVGWILGVCAAVGMLNAVRAILMAPRAFALDTFDPVAFSYTIPLPVAIMLVATLVVVGRFRRFDPVGVVERRLV